MITQPEFLLPTLKELSTSSKPKCIIANTIKGMGATSTTANLEFHHIRSMSEELKLKLLKEIANA